MPLQNITTLVAGAVLALLVGRGFFWGVSSFVYARLENETVALIGGVAAWLTAVTYTFFGGLYRNGPYEKAVGLVVGNPIRYILPPGWSWWLPRGIGGSVAINMQTMSIDRTNQPLEAVPAADNITVSISYLAQVRVTDPYTYATVENPLKALQNAIDQGIREFANLHPAEDLTKKKREFVDSIDNNETVKEVAEECGLEIVSLSVDDVNLPEEIVGSRIKQVTEIQEAKAEETETNNVLNLMQKYKEKFPNLSDQQILNAVQAERGKIRRLVVEGSAGDFTKGAAVSSLNKE